MKTTTIANQKGGVGKTTTAVSHPGTRPGHDRPAHPARGPRPTGPRGLCPERGKSPGPIPADRGRRTHRESRSPRQRKPGDHPRRQAHRESQANHRHLQLPHRNPGTHLQMRRIRCRDFRYGSIAGRAARLGAHGFGLGHHPHQAERDGRGWCQRGAALDGRSRRTRPPAGVQHPAGFF